MTRRGRPAKPVRDTTWFAPPANMPAAPSDLTGAAASEWERLRPLLESLSRVSRIDILPLVEYCSAWGRFEHLMREHFRSETDDLDAEGPSSRVAHPLLAPLLDSANAILMYGEQWGLTARSRDLDGNNRIPTEVKRLFGNRHKIAESKIPESVVPMLPPWQTEDMEPPLWMNDKARNLYNTVGTDLSNLDMFTPLDRIHLIVMCCLHELILRAHEQITNDLVEVTNKEGEVKYERANPLYEVINKLTAVTKKYYAAYGMTAQARRLLPKEEKTEAKRPLIFKGRFGG